MRAAIISAVIGDSYKLAWQRFCQANWEAYADKHGFDIVLIDKPFDTTSGKSFSWQKLLIGRAPRVQDYSHLIWIDADIIINASLAPNILEGIRPGKVGAVKYHAVLGKEKYLQAHRAMCYGETPRDFNAGIFREHGLTDADPDCLLNAGVLVVPVRHLFLLEWVYHQYENVSRQQQEQPYISYTLHRNGLTQFIDPRFNAVWYEYKHLLGANRKSHTVTVPLMSRVLSQVHFLHFAGSHEDMHAFGSATLVQQAGNDAAKRAALAGA